MKSEFYIDKISKKKAEELLLEYHYLKDISKGFKSGYNYGLFQRNEFSPLNIADSQTQKKISTMQTELNTLEAKLKVLQESGKNAPASTDM
jgi:hypothetical protein